MRRCFNLCAVIHLVNSFDMIDDLIKKSRMSRSSLWMNQFAPVVDACSLCDMCFMTKWDTDIPHDFDHEWDFPHLMLRYRMAQKKKGHYLKMVPETISRNR